LLPLESSQRSEFITTDGMRGWRSPLGSPDGHIARIEIDLRPLQVNKLYCPKAVPVTGQDHGRVTMSIAVMAGCLHQPINLALG
jgi:hypothetical protein